MGCELNKKEFVQNIVQAKDIVQDEVSVFSPTNIALIKYWGKRNDELNLPVTSSLSITLNIGTQTKIVLADSDRLFLNGSEVCEDELFYKRTFSFLNLFRSPHTFFQVHTKNDMPTSAGIASSASGFSALTLALNELYGWNLSRRELSMLARLGSGSSSRSLFSGFVEWYRGDRDDGLDSFAQAFSDNFTNLSVGLWIVDAGKKPISSRDAMKQTMQSSTLYKAWPEVVDKDLAELKKAIGAEDFTLLGSISERNSLAMHATMLASSPPICYYLPESIQAMQHIWNLRRSGLEVYFTMDAGPNLKLLFLKKDRQRLQQNLTFPLTTL